jgi:hypothetical protein
MLRITLAACAIYLSTLLGFSQPASDSSDYKPRKLTFEEVNFVSSYYGQDGNNSAVTGGIGTEKLTDFATTIDLRLSRYDRRARKHTLTGEVGIDVYTSASSDKIDPQTVTSASYKDNRFYPSLSYSITNDKKGSTTSIGISASTEYDYFSKGFSIGWSKMSKDRNREFSAKAQVFLDQWSVILPIELRGSSDYAGTEPRNSYSASVTFSQVISQRLQLMLLTDLALQNGQLATLYHRTYFQDGTHRVERLPDSRLKIPVGARLNYFFGDFMIARMYYRYYQDSWDLKAHSIEIEAPLKLSSFFSISPFYRFYHQDGVKYFRSYGEHLPSEDFYTSDFDLSTFDSHMGGVGLRLAPPGGVAGITKLNAIELRYGHYVRSTGLDSNIITLLMKIK